MMGEVRRIPKGMAIGFCNVCQKPFEFSDKLMSVEKAPRTCGRLKCMEAIGDA